MRHTVEFATLSGLEEIASEELLQVLGPDTTVTRFRPGSLRVGLSDLSMVDRPRVSGVAYLIRHFEVPRPRAILGNQHLEELVSDVRLVLRRLPGAFSALRISAAGDASPVLLRLAGELGEAVDLPVEPEEGDLVVRVFPEAEGWTTAVRLTPRPLSARPWRIAEFPGALEATVAAAMVRVAETGPEDLFVDLCCGSGTIAIERALAGPAAAVLGLDVADSALRAFERNALAAGTANVLAVRGDAVRVPLEREGASVVASNPPWGHQMGTVEDARQLYPALLDEAARVTMAGGRFVLLSHQVRLTQDLLALTAQWTVTAEYRVAMRGHHPRIWVLRRS